jgi:hypothetical protein
MPVGGFDIRAQLATSDNVERLMGVFRDTL